MSDDLASNLAVMKILKKKKNKPKAVSTRGRSMPTKPHLMIYECPHTRTWNDF